MLYILAQDVPCAARRKPDGSRLLSMVAVGSRWHLIAPESLSQRVRSVSRKQDAVRQDLQLSRSAEATIRKRHLSTKSSIVILQFLI